MPGAPVTPGPAARPGLSAARTAQAPLQLDPQKISRLPCICDPAREAAERGRGMCHVTLWCGACSDQGHRDIRFYEPPHEVGHNRPLSGWMTRPDT
jgi:hypothetical protein